MGALHRKSKKWIVALVVISVSLCVVERLFFQFADLKQSFANNFHDLPCTLPKINPFDKSISKYFSMPEPLNCDSGIPDIVYVDDDNRIRFNQTAFRYLPNTRPSDVKCSFRSVERCTDDTSFKIVDIDVDVDSADALPSDFTLAHCEKENGEVLYDNILSGIRSSPRVHGTRGSQPKLQDESADKLNVFLFGVDSVSRPASFRYLPKTREYLTQIGAYDFEGLMKVGDNTLPNIMALLTGESKVPDTLVNGPFDPLPFIWKNFSSNGYVTMHAEDSPHITEFNFMNRKGFTDPPTDHYMRPFWLYLHRDKIKYHLHSINRLLEDKGIRFQKQSEFCNKNTKSHMEMIEYFKKFLRHYRQNRKFTFSHLSELSHTHLNFLHFGDEDFANLFRWMKHERFLNNSVLIFFSDHGSRYNGLRNTYIGRMESRMPMLYILLPDHIKTKHPSLHQNMIRNTKRLITHYDIHQMMLDILASNFQNPSSQKVNRTRHISLFGEIPESRSCADAGIPPDYCACYKSKRVDIENNSTILKISAAVVKYINNGLRSEKYCKRLSLNKVLSAEMMFMGLEFKHSSWVDYLYPAETNRVSYSVTIETIPGYATFDTMVEVDSAGSILVQPNIDRTNEYGNQTDCVQNASLKQFCYC